MQISYLWISALQTGQMFLKFSRGVFNFRSISVVDSISVMSKYNMMQFFFFINVKPYKIHFTDPRCPVRNILGRKVLISPKNSWI